jgi:hypothetical protein
LCGSGPLAAVRAALDVLLRVVPRAAGVRHHQRQQRAAETVVPASKPAERSTAEEPADHERCTSTASSPGTTISRSAARVVMSTQRRCRRRGGRPPGRLISRNWRRTFLDDLRAAAADRGHRQSPPPGTATVAPMNKPTRYARIGQVRG